MHKKFRLLLISVSVLFLAQTGLFAQTQESEPPAEGPPILLDQNSVKFNPSAPETGDKLTLQIKMGEQAASAEVRWSVNGDHLDTVFYDGAAESLELNRAIKSGDVIEVEVTPYHISGSPGIPITKKVICRKAPPNLKLAEQKIDGNIYRAKVEAKDPEGEPLTLSIEGPQGMAIDQKGTITWKFSQNATGKFDVKVTAKDKTGSLAELTYSFRISRR